MVSTHLGAEQTSVLRNREVSLIRRSSTHLYGRQFGTLVNCPYKMEVSVIWRAIIERFHCICTCIHCMFDYVTVNKMLLPYIST